MIGFVTGTRAVIAAVVLGLGLAGCSSDDPEPRIAPPSTPTAPSTTGTSAETPPEMPEAAKGTDAAAAEAFVEFFFEMVNYAQVTGDVQALKDLARLCAGCESGTTSIVDTYEHDGQIRGGEGSARQFKVGFLERDPRPWASVECTVFTTEQTVDMPGRANDERYPAGSTDVRLLIEPTTDGWVVRSLVTR
jgi:hypothetical protein